MSTKPVERTFGWTDNQIDVLLALTEHGPLPSDKTVPHGVYRSLVIRGMIMLSRSGNYCLTPDGLKVAAGLRVGERVVIK